MAIEAVIWDFGGVISTSPFDSFNRFEESRGLPRDLIRRINAANPHDNAWARYERSEITAEQFDSAFAEEAAALGHAVRGAEIMTAISGEIRPAVVTALKACKARFKVGCITNNMTGAGDGP
ncbi:MAG: HAD family hydrolase, partial [Caulobacteraceae bacterium]|nr:HAD family hydrolase [Caulobacteraceae bacterium]